MPPRPVFDQRATIARPPAEVWSYFVDLRNMPAWVRGLRAASQATPGPLAAGTRLREEREMGGKVPAVDVTVDRCEPPRLLRRTARTPAGRFTYTYTFDEVPGGTEVRIVGEAEPEGLAQRLLLTRLGAGMVARQDADLAQRLKAAVEAPAARGPAGR